MQNYKQRIPLGPDKWAFEQVEGFASAAKVKMRDIRKVWRRPPHFYHLRRGGHVAATKLHLESDYFAKIDLKRFFEQVSRNRVVKRLTALGFSFTEAEDFAIASTVRHSVDRTKFVVPYGFVQSPLLASIDLDFSALGQAIRTLKSSDIRVSVYVDDIIVSSNDEQAVRDAFGVLINAAAAANYEVNEDKSQPCGDRLGAFNLNISRGFMAVNEARLSEFVEDIGRAGDSPESTAILLYVETINPQQADELIAHFGKNISSGAVAIQKRRLKASQMSAMGEMAGRFSPAQ